MRESERGGGRERERGGGKERDRWRGKERGRGSWSGRGGEKGEREEREVQVLFYGSESCNVCAASFLVWSVCANLLLMCC